VSHLEVTPSQTVGPFFSIGLPWPEGPFAAAEHAPGAFTISGTVFDGEGSPIPDALVETWQGGAGPGVRGFARAPTTDDGRYALRTVKPAASDGQAPHIDVSLFCRGLLHRVVTRIYFADEASANAADPTLARVPADRRDTLLAAPTDDGYRFDIHLQGDGETVFFDV
jgi:protocatechuate 3,4-dioxygenase alpha subunit